MNSDVMEVFRGKHCYALKLLHLRDRESRGDNLMDAVVTPLTISFACSILCVPPVWFRSVMGGE